MPSQGSDHGLLRASPFPKSESKEKVKVFVVHDLVGIIDKLGERATMFEDRSYEYTR